MIVPEYASRFMIELIMNFQKWEAMLIDCCLHQSIIFNTRARIHKTS